MILADHESRFSCSIVALGTRRARTHVTYLIIREIEVDVYSAINCTHVAYMCRICETYVERTWSVRDAYVVHAWHTVYRPLYYTFFILLLMSNSNLFTH